MPDNARPTLKNPDMECLDCGNVDGESAFRPKAPEESTAPEYYRGKFPLRY